MDEVKVHSAVDAALDDVSTRTASVEGINDELRPWLKMTIPRHLRDRTLDDGPLGVRLGRSWVLLFGLIPFDYDDLVLAERRKVGVFSRPPQRSRCRAGNTSACWGPESKAARLPTLCAFSPVALAVAVVPLVASCDPS